MIVLGRSFTTIFWIVGKNDLVSASGYTALPLAGEQNRKTVRVWEFISQMLIV